MRTVPDWLIQTSWWVSGIFATGAGWYFLSMREFGFAFAAAIAAALFAGLAIWLHRKKDSLLLSVSTASQAPQVKVETDKAVTATWWDASNLRKEYEGRGLSIFRWSNADRVPEREQEGYEVVYEENATQGTRHRIINKSGQVLVAKRAA